MSDCTYEIYLKAKIEYQIKYTEFLSGRAPEPNGNLTASMRRIIRKTKLDKISESN